MRLTAPKGAHNPRITKLLAQHGFRLVSAGGNLWNYERPLFWGQALVIADTDGQAPMRMNEETHLYLFTADRAEPKAEHTFASVSAALAYVERTRYRRRRTRQ